MPVILHHYRPHLDKAEDLEAISVAREPLLNEMLARLQRWEPGASRQHYLLIGPRGIGKTHVLRLLQHRILGTPEAERKWFPLLFPEEQYAVTSVPDLLIETLRLLSEASRDRVLTDRYLRVKKEADDQTVVDLACGALREFCAERRSGVLLMLENLDRLLQDQIKKDTQTSLLRKILIEENWPVLVATSPTYVNDVRDPEKPLFEFFQVILLGELSPESVETLLRKRAQLDDDDHFLAYLDRYRSRLRALYHFSGGNPRLTLMLYDLLARQAITDIRIELEGLLNQLTPFYQDRMKEMGAQEAKVLTTMASLAEGVTPTDLAEECRMDRALVSALLSRLEKAGYVRREPRSNKQTIYTIPERFFRIWHQMASSRVARGRVQYLLDFFSTWYATAEERDEAWNSLVAQFREGTGCGEEDRIRDISTYMDYIVTVSEGTEQLQRLFDLLQEHVQAGNMSHVLEEIEKFDHQFSGNADYFVHKGEFLATAFGTDERALEAFRQALQLNRGQLEALFNEAVALDRLCERQAARDTYARAIELLSTQRGRRAVKNTTQFLLHLLRKEPEGRLVRIAAHLLGRIADASTWPKVMEIVRCADTPWRRSHAITALGLLGPADAVPALVPCLHDGPDCVRRAAATALGNIGAPGAVPALIETLCHDTDPMTRGAAVTALGRIGAPEAVPLLIEVLRGSGRASRRAAATALGKIGAPEAVPLLVEALRDSDQVIRGAAATALGRIGASEVVPVLIEVLRDPADSVRSSAATALGRVGASEAVPLLVEALHDSGRVTRGAAATALGKIGASEAVPPLMEALRDPADNVRGSAATALGRLGAFEAVPALIKALHDPAENVCISAAMALGRIGASEAAPELITAMSNENRTLRWAAVTALGKMNAFEAVAPLIRYLREDSEPTHRGAAAVALGNIGAQEAARALIESLRNEAVTVRAEAAAALGKIGVAEAVPALIECLQDDADGVRANACGALGRIGAVDAVPSLIACLQDKALGVRTAAAVTLGKLGTSKSLSALIECLDDKSHEMRRAVVVALGKIGAPEAASALAKSLRDEDIAVRGSVGVVLRRIITGKTAACLVDAIPDLCRSLSEQGEDARTTNVAFFLQAAFRSGSLSIVQAFVEGFASGLTDCGEILLPYRIALEFLRRKRNPTVVYRQPPEMREAIELLVSAFDQAEKGN